MEKTVLSSGGGGGGGGSAAPMASGSRDLPVPAVGGGGGGDVSPSVAAFDEYLKKNLDPFLAACGKLGGGAAKGVSGAFAKIGVLRCTAFWPFFFS